MSDFPETAKVRDLIALLQEMDPDYPACVMLADDSERDGCRELTISSVTCEYPGYASINVEK
jgi:hypothetical protein